MSKSCNSCGRTYDTEHCPICRENDTPRKVYAIVAVPAILLLLFCIASKFAPAMLLSCAVSTKPTDIIDGNEDTTQIGDPANDFFLGAAWGTSVTGGTQTSDDKPQHPAKFTSFSASSSYNKDKYNKAVASDAFDGSTSTCWQDGVKGYGEGEYLVASADRDQLVYGFTFRNGYQKKNNKDLYKKNSRVKRITVSWYDENGNELVGKSQSFDIEDKKADQYFEFREPVVTRRIKITIDEVYKGSKYADTCISDIIFN